METFSATIERLVGALESLSGTESVLMAEGAWNELAFIQERSASIVEKLGELMSRPGAFAELDAPLFARVRALTEDQEKRICLLDQLKSACADELRALGNSRRQVRNVAPAYRAPAGAPSQLSFAARG